MRAVVLVLTIALGGCGGEATVAGGALAPAPPVEASSPTLRRLTQTEYRAAVEALLGDGLALPLTLEPDTLSHGLYAIGAGVTTVSALGVERYETAAWLLVDQIDAERLAALLPCAPIGPGDAACAARAVAEVGRSAWRRPLVADEIDRLTDLVVTIGEAEDDFAVGFGFALGAMLQSPHFLYRVEHGVNGRLTDHELATRLSFLLWARPPDRALLDAADQGSLSDPDTYAAEVDRLLADPRAVDGVRAFVADWLRLDGLDALEKDPMVFDHAHPDLGPSAREETLRLFGRFALGDEDIRHVLITRETQVDPRLAALYRVPAPDPLGFAPITLPNDGTRRGLLGHASVLALNAFATRSSATLRGAMVRRTLLCQDLPDPPADVDTSIPEPDASSPTLRDRIAVHLEEPACATCHQYTDPIGLGLENFDGIGRWRDSENGATIDPSGDLDDVPFADAWDLGGALASHPLLLPCWTDRLVAFGVGRTPSGGEAEAVAWLAEALVHDDHRWEQLLRRFVASDLFQTVGAIE